jgi:radical SAM superfamily enzyme YgiQ (UPF0313 family)
MEHKWVGLVGAAVSDYREIGELCRHILRSGGKMSVSSLRLDNLDEELIEALKSSGHKTVAIAPEGGSQRLRDLIKKELNEEQILAACERLIAGDILNLKLYFIVGLPTETIADLEEMVRLVAGIRERVVESAKKRGRLGEIVLSVNPFVPKPFTPLQWCAMENVKSLEEKIGFLRNSLAPMANVRMIAESPRDAYLQALISRGDRRLGALLLKADELGNWKRGAKGAGIDTDRLVYREIPLDETLPWEVIDGGDRELLEREYRKALRPALTKGAPPGMRRGP